MPSTHGVVIGFVGGPELVLIIVVFLVLAYGEKAIGMTRELGEQVGKVNHSKKKVEKEIEEVRQEVDDDLDDIKNDVAVVEQEIKSATDVQRPKHTKKEDESKQKQKNNQH